MEREQARQLGIFGWVITVFIGYPALFGWLTWKLIQFMNAPKGLMVIGVCVGLFLATYHLLQHVKKEEALDEKLREEEKSRKLEK